MVSSLMRSGTHLLIDLILNNFPSHRNSPLYVDLDQYLAAGRPVADLMECGDCLIKTHHPQSQMNDAVVAALARRCHIIQPVRSLSEVRRSLQSFGRSVTLPELERDRERFEEFWGAFPVLKLGFNELVRQDRTSHKLTRISEFTGLPHTTEIVPPLRRSEVAKAMLLKVSTRLLGRHSPRINTTIQFATTPLAPPLAGA